MPSERDRAIGRLTDIVENIEAAREFVNGLDYERFKLLREKVYAVTRALEIISEASRHLPDEIKACHIEVDW